MKRLESISLRYEYLDLKLLLPSSDAPTLCRCCLSFLVEEPLSIDGAYTVVAT